MLYELKNIRTKNGLSRKEAAEKLNTPFNTYRNWEQCLNMPQDKTMLKKIADLFGVSIEALFGYDLIEPGGFAEIYDDPDSKFISVPLVANVAAGPPQYPDEAEREIPIPYEVMKRHRKAYLAKVDGTSMDRVLPNGSYALIDPEDKEVVNGKIYAVRINGELATIKRVRRLEHGVVLEPDSATDPSHEPLVLKESNEKYEDLAIDGRVVWYMLNLDEDFDA